MQQGQLVQEVSTATAPAPVRAQKPPRMATSTLKMPTLRRTGQHSNKQQLALPAQTLSLMTVFQSRSLSCVRKGHSMMLIQIGKQSAPGKVTWSQSQIRSTQLVAMHMPEQVAQLVSTDTTCLFVSPTHLS